MNLYILQDSLQVLVAVVTGNTCIFKPELLKHHTKIAADNILIFYFYLLKKIRLDFSCESSVRWQRIHLKHQVLFCLKNNEKIFMNVVCCSHEWRFEG